MEQLPETKRHLVAQIQKRLYYKLAPIIVLKGSRQIGKTTACLQVIKDLLDNGIEPERIFRLQFDDIQAFRETKEPILQLIDWYENNIICSTLNNKARDNKHCFLFMDEVQNLVDWSSQLKFLVDTSTVQIVVTGSSALRIELGRDSLAGRINTIEANTLSLTEIGAIRKMNPPVPYLPDNGLNRIKDKQFWLELHEYGLKHKEFKDNAFHFFSERGGYPIAHTRPDIPWDIIADQINETIITRVIQHDIRIGEKGRKRDAQLLEELFRFCCRYAGQAPGIGFIADEMNKKLNTSISNQRINIYLKFLADTLLVRLIQPLEFRLKKHRSNNKICLADHGLRASWLQESTPLDLKNFLNNEDLFTLSGYIAESIVGTLFSSISGLNVAHLPADNRDPEVDFVLIVGDQRIPVEIKYRNRIKNEHIKGLKWFMDKPVNRASFGLLICKNDDEIIDDERVIPVSLSTLLLMR